MLSQLDKKARGYRPAEAVIDLPAEGALAFLEHLAQLASQKANGASKFSVGSVEFLHLAKFGNNIKSMAAGRIAPRPNLLEQYEAIVGGPGQLPPYRNPLFRRGLMLSLLKDQEWHEPMSPIMAELPWPLFVRSEQSPENLSWFWRDAAEKFRELANQHDSERMRYLTMSKQSPDLAGRDPQTPLPLLIHRLVQKYVNSRTEERSGIKRTDFKDKKIKDEKTGKERVAVPEAYREAREKVASGAFLEMRSRREQAFVDHFTATFCSVKQFLPEKEFSASSRRRC